MKRPHQEDLIDLKALISLIKRRKWIIILSVLMITGSAYYIAFEYLMPVYESSSTIELFQERNNFPGDNEGINLVLSMYNQDSNQSLESEIYNFRSSEVTEVVAEQIKSFKYQPDGKIYPILWKEYPVDSTLVDLRTLASRISRKINIEPVERGANFLKVSIQSHSPYESARLTNLIVNRYLEWSDSKKRASASSALTFLENEKQRVEDELNTAENQLGAFMNEEELIQLEAQATASVNALSDLIAEKEAKQIELQAVNSAIGNYEARIEAIRPGLAKQYSEAIGPTISRYQQELAELTTRRFIILSNNPGLRENQNSEPELRRINRQIADLQEEIERLTENLISINPDSSGFAGGGDGNLTQEIGNIQSSLIQLRIQRNQLETQVVALDQRINNIRLFLDDVPENRIQLARLQRMITTHEEMFRALSTQYAEVVLWEQALSSVGNVVNSAAVPANPIKPVKEIWLLAGFFAGLVLPVGLFSVTEKLNSRIQSIEDLKSKPFPLLSVIYDHKKVKREHKKKQKKEKSTEKKIPEDLIVAFDDVSPNTESYRRLVNNTIYMDPEKSNKIFMVTSPGQGEGKTTTAGNMGAAYAELGMKVLIIDCDMRRPSLNKFFNEPASPGITEILFDKQKVTDCIRSTVVQDLFILTTGKRVPKPASVLGSTKLRELINHVKIHFDIIILDTTPYGIISDLAPLIKITDGIILVSRFAVTKKFALDHTIEQIQKTRGKINGLVLNAYNSKKSQDTRETHQLYDYVYREYYDYMN
ncbi:GumC family protein [Rhodohalobacter sp. 8-1]|uniref:GumC family protein n=1 Tax=Rhodohalobacter sp. 8-1 TaxID=3131972 RepID=UPI0030EC0DF1